MFNFNDFNQEELFYKFSFSVAFWFYVIMTLNRIWQN